jgi:hypothetical protein
MEVPSTHAFVVGPGVAVHNCMDCLRYLCLKGTEIARTQPLGGATAPSSRPADSTVGY